MPLWLLPWQAEMKIANAPSRLTHSNRVRFLRPPDWLSEVTESQHIDRWLLYYKICVNLIESASIVVLAPLVSVQIKTASP